MPIAIVANTIKAGTGNSATSDAIDTSGSNALVAVVNSYGVAVSLADSKSNTWIPLVEYGGGPRIRLFYCLGPTVGSGHTFTGTASGGFPSVSVLALSGVLAASAFDAENGAAAVQPGSVTPSEDNEILITSLSFYPSNTVSINSGFTISNQVDFSNGVNMGLAMAYKIQTSAGAENPTWSPSSSFTEQASAIACFKSAAASGNRRRRLLLGATG